MRNIYLFIAVSIALAATLTLSHALLRSAANYNPFDADWFFRVGGALILYAAVFFSYSVVLKYFDLSVLYPTYTALSVLGVFLVGVFYFGEYATLQKFIGAIIVMVGVVLLAI